MLIVTNENERGKRSGAVPAKENCVKIFFYIKTNDNIKINYTK